MIRPLAIALTALLAMSCRGNDAAPPADSATASATPTGPANYVATVVRSYPHDPAAFTEGLFIKDGKLYEGTGLEGKSDIRRTDLATGTVELRRPLDPKYFGEGIVAFGDVLYELTWKNGKAFTYDLATFAPRPQTFTYYGEGWGLTTDGESLIMSDGTARLRFLDPKTFAVRRTLDVHDGASPVSQLNELEWVKGELLANIWQSQQIVRIDPKTGAVTGWIDLSTLPLATDRTGKEDVLNGIAYDAAQDKLYVTGKNYARLYEVRLDRR
ncbi:glutaminyl-peptide cyclotransferase [Gemmatimonadetes bacterium T265]|nr:glutaminyl-peptide cyclotransferase [Gemmatimonadetes bacterium T265]